MQEKLTPDHAVTGRGHYGMFRKLVEAGGDSSTSSVGMSLRALRGLIADCPAGVHEVAKPGATLKYIQRMVKRGRRLS